MTSVYDAMSMMDCPVIPTLFSIFVEWQQKLILSRNHFFNKSNLMTSFMMLVYESIASIFISLRIQRHLNLSTLTYNFRYVF